MTRARLLSLTAALLLSCGGASADDVAAVSSSLFPTAVGTEWVYQAGPIEVTEKVTRHELIGNEPCARVETIYNGKTINYEHVAVRPDGVYRVAVAGKQATPAFRLIKLPALSSDRWDIASRVDGKLIEGRFESSVTTANVPAGDFQALSIHGRDFVMSGRTVDFTYYYAPNVGKVKQVVKLGETQTDLQLKKFTPGRGVAGQ